MKKRSLIILILVVTAGIFSSACKKSEPSRDAYIKLVNQANCDVEYGIAGLGIKDSIIGTVAAHTTKKETVEITNERFPILVDLLNWASCHLEPPMIRRVNLKPGETKEVILKER